MEVRKIGKTTNAKNAMTMPQFGKAKKISNKKKFLKIRTKTQQ